jgi:hypothetical protein
MTGMPTTFELKSFEIDLSKPAPTPSTVAVTSQEDFVFFVRELARKVNSSNSTRNFTFNDSSQVKISIEKILGTGFLHVDVSNIAKYLYDAETTFSGRYKISDIKQGNLLISRFKIESDDLLLIAKVDFESFFAKTSFKKEEGLPTEKGLLKAALFKLDNGKLPLLFKIADSNSSISKFWSNEFLDSSPYKSDSENTINAFSMIIKSVNKVLKNSTVDKVALANSVITYFTTRSKFDAGTFVNDAIGNYTCEGDVVISDVVSEIEKVFKLNKFDGIFSIISSEIKTKMKKTYKLEDDISIVTNQGTKGRIYSKNLGGKKYVLIQSNAGYDQFPELK